MLSSVGPQIYLKLTVWLTQVEVHYKKKHRPVKVRLLDDTIKTFLVDESLTIVAIVAVIGEKMSIGNPEEYSLKAEGTADDDWLNPSLSLHENNVAEDGLVLLKKKFFFTDRNVDR